MGNVTRLSLHLRHLVWKSDEAFGLIEGWRRKALDDDDHGSAGRDSACFHSQTHLGNVPHLVLV